MTDLNTEKRRFIDFAVEAGVLRFGRFTLKSGRESPYFFNLGVIASGARLDRLGEFYARLLEDLDPPPDVLFGPAYKGIPLAVAAACAYAREGADLGVAYNRKEAKDHGEGGHLVGAPLEGMRVCIIDDVVTAGTAVREAIGLIRSAGATPAALVVAIDREERGRSGQRSAIRELAAEEGIDVRALISFSDVLAWLEESGSYAGEREALLAYREQYGASV